MLYTTRNPREAEKFVDALPFDENEKIELKSFFPVLTDFMAEIRKNKGLNSKGAERMFSERILKKVKESEEILARFFSGFNEDAVGAATKFLMIQSSVASECVQIGKDYKVSEKTILGLEKYCDFMNSLVSKYSGIDDLLDEDDSNTKVV